MRIAVSGTHLVGKTTLAEAMAARLPGHELVPEPYHLLEEEGHEFADMPSIDDFERQLERSLQCLQDCDEDVIFDRCPLDILGYLMTHRDADWFDIARWMPRIEESVTRLDLVVFVPIEHPDRVPVAGAEARLRADVDAVLNDLIADDAQALGFDVITVEGTLDRRLDQVFAHLGQRSQRRVGPP